MNNILRLLLLKTIADAWTLTIQTTAPLQAYSLDINSGTNIKIDIDWGDGVVTRYTTTGIKSHTYALAGTYRVRVSGSMTAGNIRQDSTGTYANAPKVKATSAIKGITGLLNFSFTFYGCTGLTSLPTDLFRYNTAVSTSGFFQTFYGCTGLTSLPTDLFRYNTAVSTWGFRATFDGCTGLTVLPTDLFRYNTAVSTSGFYYIFNGCTGLTSLPTDLFRYNTAVSTSGFRQTFQGCTGLTSLPTDLFRYNTAVSTEGFYSTFYGCGKLQLNSWIFFATGEEGTRFLNRVSDFTSCFRFTGAFTGTKGTAPALWDCSFGTQTPVTTDCFTGHSTDSVDNYASIPTAWGGAA